MFLNLDTICLKLPFSHLKVQLREFLIKAISVWTGPQFYYYAAVSTLNKENIEFS